MKRIKDWMNKGGEKAILSTIPIAVFVSFAVIYLQSEPYNGKWIMFLWDVVGFIIFSIILTSIFSGIRAAIEEKETPTPFDCVKVSAVSCIVLFVFFKLAKM